MAASLSRFAALDGSVMADTLSAAENRFSVEVCKALGNPNDSRAVTFAYALLLDCVASIDVAEVIRSTDPDQLYARVTQHAKDLFTRPAEA